MEERQEEPFFRGLSHEINSSVSGLQPFVIKATKSLVLSGYVAPKELWGDIKREKSIGEDEIARKRSLDTDHISSFFFFQNARKKSKITKSMTKLEDGITPSYGLMAAVKEQVKIPIHVLARPRSGHFTYSKTEFEVLLGDIKFCKEIGVEGIVSGALNADNSLDLERTKQMLACSTPLHFTFHRAFDWVPNPLETLELLEKVGVNTILTSGQQSKALKGIGLLSQLHSKTKNITVMAGAGINASNAEKFKDIGLKAIHLSGTEFENFVSLEGKVSMNSPNHLIENQVAVSNVSKIIQTLKSVK